jgi:hypothetical protein
VASSLPWGELTCYCSFFRGPLLRPGYLLGWSFGRDCQGSSYLWRVAQLLIRLVPADFLTTRRVKALA